MNKKVFFLFLLFLFSKAEAQDKINWTPEQLLEPFVLAAKLKSGKDLPVIFSVGPGALIPNSVAIGMTNEKENLEVLKKKLSLLPKNKTVVIYCGCCPFEHCPNVRPAIDVLKSLQFTHYQLLNIPKNLKTDWIDKGYPTSKS